MTKLFPFTFEVQGRVPFPTDMLRYDECYPADATSAAAIASSLDQIVDTPREGYTVRLRSMHLPFGPTSARWESFMWKVVDMVDDL